MKAVEVQSLEELSYLAETGEGKEALVKTGDGCHPLVGRSPVLIWLPAGLGEGTGALVKAGDGCHPDVAI